MGVVSVWILTCLIWSTVWLFIKVGVNDVPPITFAAVRLMVALTVMVPVVVIARVPGPRRRSEWYVIGASAMLVIAANYSLVYWGAQFITSGLTAVLQSVTPALALVFAHYLLHDERMTARKMAGLLLGVAGIAIIYWDQLRFGGRALSGSIAVTAGAACVALAYVMMRRSGTGVHPSAIITGQMSFAILPLIAGAWMLEGSPFTVQWTRNAAISLLYLALMGSVLGGWLNYWLLPRVGAVNLLIMGLVEPPIAILLGGWILDERMNVRTLVGSGLILLSVWMAMAPRLRSGQAPALGSAPGPGRA